MRDLIEGRIDRDTYARLVAQLRYVYLELESAAEVMKGKALAAPFVKEELRRVPALESDLEFLVGDDWVSRVEPTEATAEYCARLREVGATWVGGFVAHHYTRYMGDLSGGQFIGKMVEKHYDLKDHIGASFYVFDGISDPTAFKNEYRALLDRTPWTEAEKQRIIDEVLLAYRFNGRLLDALQ
jgi:heme oxygenase